MWGDLAHQDLKGGGRWAGIAETSCDWGAKTAYLNTVYPDVAGKQKPQHTAHCSLGIPMHAHCSDSLRLYSSPQLSCKSPLSTLLPQSSRDRPPLLCMLAPRTRLSSLPPSAPSLFFLSNVTSSASVAGAVQLPPEMMKSCTSCPVTVPAGGGRRGSDSCPLSPPHPPLPHGLIVLLDGADDAYSSPPFPLSLVIP